MSFLAAVTAGLSMAGVGMAAYGQYQAGKSAEEVAEYNARVQENQAKREEYAAGYEADMLADRGKKLRAKQRVAYAKAGVTSAGTPLLVFEETAAEIAQDVAMTRWGGTQRASYYRSAAGISLMKGRSAYRAGVIGAGTSLLSGASSSLSAYMRMR